MLCRANPVNTGDDVLYEGVLADITEEISKFGGSAGDLQSALELFDSKVIALDSEFRVQFTTLLPGKEPLCNFGDLNFNFLSLKGGKPFLDCFLDPKRREHYSDILKRLIQGSIHKILERIQQRDRMVALELHRVTYPTAAYGIVLFIRDVTAITELEKEAVVYSRTTSYIDITGSFLHHMNNILQTVFGLARSIQNHPHLEKQLKINAATIAELTEQAGNLTHLLLPMNAALSSKTQAIDLNVILFGVLNALHDVLAKGVKIAISFSVLPPVLGVAGPLTNTLEGIIRDILERTKSETLTVTTTLASSDDLSDLEESQVKISITNNSVSHSKTQELLTTSALRNCAFVGAIEAMGGKVRIEKGSNRQDSIAVYLPIESSKLIDHESELEESLVPRVLLIDDDEFVCGTVSAIVSESGYPIRTATSGASAISLLQEFSESVELILVDALLPGTHGSSLVRRLKKIKPTVTILGFSGAAEAECDKLRKAGAIRVLRKPLDPKTLVNAIREYCSKSVAA